MKNISKCIGLLVLLAGCSTSDPSSPAESVPDAGPKPREPGDPGDGSGQADGGSVVDGGDQPGEPDGWHYDPEHPFGASPPALDALDHSLAPTSLWGELSGPYPTNAWFLGLVLGDGAQRVNVLPYFVAARAQELGISDPELVVSENAIVTGSQTDVALGAQEGFDGHALEAFDNLSATVLYRSSTGFMRVPLVRGMPYVTAFYDALTPSIAVPVGIASVNGKAEGPFSGTRFELLLNDGRIWLMYASSPIELVRSDSGLRATAAFQGTLRVAHRFDDAAGPLLDAHAGAVPTGGALSMTVRGDRGELGFDFTVQGQGELLMMALPHHLPRLPETQTAELRRRTLRGTMQGVVGARWTLSYPLSQVTWNAARAVKADKVEELRTALMTDASYVPVAQDPYFAGKQLARLARLALVADELSETAVRDTILTRLAPLSEAWFAGTNDHALGYDRTWGGVVTKVGAVDSGADFGQGYYNDHHFHYGYHLYVAAVLSRYDSEWAERMREQVLVLARDIANPSTRDPYFTPFRNLDFFEGHGWAAGLFPFADGRNQESTSEAVNAWYGLELYGRALGDEDITNLGRMLRAIEVDGAQVYWQIVADGDIYPAPFSQRRGVGILWSNKLDFATFFGAEPAKIYGIQMIPFTPVSEELLDPAWVKDAQAAFDDAANIESEGFRGFMHMANAVVDQEAAARDIAELREFDDGNSLTNTLYWLYTR